jgi:hypothetical protein
MASSWSIALSWRIGALWGIETIWPRRFPVRIPRVRFTVRRLMIAVAVVGVELAAIRWSAPLSKSPLGDAIAVNFPVAVLLAAALLARFGGRDSSAWWFGFALFGGAQLLLGTVFLPYHEDSLMPWTHRGTLAIAGWYWETDADHRFKSLNDIPLNPGYGVLLEVLYVKANAAMSLVVAAAGGLITHFIAAWAPQSLSDRESRPVEAA